MPRRDPLPRFDPEPHRAELVSIIRAIEELPDEGEPIGVAQFDFDTPGLSKIGFEEIY